MLLSAQFAQSLGRHSIPSGSRPSCAPFSARCVRAHAAVDHAGDTVREPVLNIATPSTSAQPLYEVSVAANPSATDSPIGDLAAAAANPAVWTIAAGAGLAAFGAAKLFEQGSRKYTGNVGDEYDAWTQEGILEYYWGEHIHLGYYTDAERAAGYKNKNFKQAKYDFCDQMLRFSGVQQFSSVLDVGCGFGGTSRYIAKNHPNAQVLGITLSPKQVERGMELAQEHGVGNAKMQVMDALAMDFPDNSFDLVWACESGEHMPDKKKYVEEMTRVLKPGGTLVIACWCQREETPDKPFSEEDKKELQFLYDEWAHPYFISIQEFERLMQGTGQLEAIRSEDWTVPTLPSWRHSIWVGVWDPLGWIFKPQCYYKCVRDAVTLERMHRAFDRGLMQYGLMRATKKLQ